VSGGNRRIADARCFHAIRAQNRNPVWRAEWARLMSSPMAQPISTPGRRLASAIVIGAAVLAAMALTGALALWFHYGTAVFFEMIVSGISACF